MKKKRITLIISIIILLTFNWLIIDNKNLVIKKYEIYSKKIEEDIVIVQISDLHNTLFGKNQKNLISKIKELNPNLITITGDFIDKRNPDIEISLDLIKGISGLAPIYYVNGNHEYVVSSEYEKLKKELVKLNVNILENQTDEIVINNTNLTIVGINDPIFSNEVGIDDKFIVDNNLKKLNINKDNFTILLSHRPEVFDVYINNDINLTLTGHTHGGQIRIPFIGAIFAPHQGVFPKYSEGIFEKDNNYMIISKGLGNSVVPIRINNRPEIVAVYLKND